MAAVEEAAPADGTAKPHTKMLKASALTQVLKQANSSGVLATMCVLMAIVFVA